MVKSAKARLRMVENGYLPCFFVHHALRDSTASVDDLRFKATESRFKALRAVKRRFALLRRVKSPSGG